MADNEALIRCKGFGDPVVWKLTRTSSLDLWGLDVLRNPIKVTASYVYDIQYDNWYSDMLFIADYYWDCLLYAEGVGGWFSTYGHQGSGEGPEFSCPTSIDVFTKQSPYYLWDYYEVYLADWWNNRIKRFEYNWTTFDYTDIGAITGYGLCRPVDLDHHNWGTFDNEQDDYLIVLNCNNRILGFMLHPLSLEFDYGCIPRTCFFDEPTAIAVGRDWLDVTNPLFQSYGNTKVLYVADAGNERIVKLNHTAPEHLTLMTLFF